MVGVCCWIHSSRLQEEEERVGMEYVAKHTSKKSNKHSTSLEEKGGIKLYVNKESGCNYVVEYAEERENAL